MPLDVIRSLDEQLLDRMVRSIPPRQLVTQISKLDRKSWFRYFKGYRPEKVSRTQVIDFVQKEVMKGDNEPVAELLVVAWNASNWNLYEAMRRNVAKINPDVEAIEKIEDEQGRAIIDELSEEFGPEDIYLCTVLNEVRFTPEFKATLKPGYVPGEEEKAAPSEAPPAEETAEAAAEETAPPDESAPAEETAE